MFYAILQILYLLFAFLVFEQACVIWGKDVDCFVELKHVLVEGFRKTESYFVTLFQIYGDADYAIV